MHEEGNVRTVFYSYVVDDGWHLPYEIVEEIEYRIAIYYYFFYLTVKLPRSKFSCFTFPFSHNYDRIGLLNKLAYIFELSSKGV